MDVIVAGAGVAGLALATALARALKPGFTVAVCDAVLANEPAADDRVSAIAAGARRLLVTLGVWERLSGPVQPIREMKITDSRLPDAVRPVFLSFDGEIAEGEPFAHMVENRDMLVALRAAAAEAGVRLVPTEVEDLEAGDKAVDVRLAGGERIEARLIAAADGARSKLRAAAGIKTVSWSYGQSGIVATVGHERDHEGCAEEHFLPGGPFAILPLAGRRSSIVWTESAAEAARLVALPQEEFHIELERRFGLKLGEIELLSRPRAYPLGFIIARTFVGRRLALVGDAAHVIHPIAGQGLNLGLRDVAALAECVTEAARLGLDPGGPDVLERYERWRRFDTVAMGIATDGLNRLFSNRSDVLKLGRDIGLGVV
ncbi:MAG: ubiquinone biosynthesis hydroxylase, partial [Xanthobacteraceae bacterium]|nr:ubiquinone biosynthesis hydroxylase [Xanthobacteraceae bacterium]